MTGPVSAAIWGSCATRHAFEVLPSCTRVDTYFARSSWVSQAGRPLPNAAQLLGDEPRRWEQRMVLADADKSICHEIIRGRPAIVLFDVVDEHRFDLLRFGGHYLTGSLILGKTGGLDRAIERFGEPTRLRSRDAERMSLFAEAVSTMARTLSAALPETRFILHAARHSSRSVDPDRPLPPNAVERSERANRVLASLESVLAASFPRMRVIQPDPAFRVADPDHKWGLSWCHYIPAYYHDFLDRFERIVMNPPVAAEATA